MRTVAIDSFRSLISWILSGDQKLAAREHLLSKQSGMHLNDDGKLLDITHKSLFKEFSEVFQVELQQKAISELEFSKG